MPPVALVRQFDTCRIIPSRFAETEESVLVPLSDGDHHLRDLFDLESATNDRLIGEYGGLSGIGVDELVFGVPHFRIINASFTHPRPEGSRFNDADRGAWYCAFDVDTALAEIIFHKTVEYHEIGRFEDSVTYQVMLADFSSEFHDLRRGKEWSDYLNPGSYAASQKLAARLLDAGSLGIVYPSVRRRAGVNLACFRPALVGNVRKGARYRMTWVGKSDPKVDLITSSKLGKMKK